MVLLDTDVMIDVLRAYPPAITWLTSLGTTEIVLPGFVVLELLQGCRNKSEQSQVEQTVARCRVEWPKPVNCAFAVTTYAQMHLSHGVGFLDVLIAHTAMMLGIPLYTFNQKHYNAISGLTTLQPYARV